MSKRFGRNQKRKLLRKLEIAEEEKRCALISASRANSQLELIREPQQFVSFRVEIFPQYERHLGETHVIKVTIKLNPVNIFHSIDISRDTFEGFKRSILGYVHSEFLHLIDNDLRSIWQEACKSK